MKRTILNGSPRMGGNTEIMAEHPKLEEVLNLVASL